MLAFHDKKNHNGIQPTAQYCDQFDFLYISQGKYGYKCNYSCTTNAGLKEHINVVHKGRSY